MEWLNSLIYAWQSLLQVWHMKVECEMKVWNYCFLHCLLISKCCFWFFSSFMALPWKACHQLLWSSFSYSQLLGPMHVSFRSFLQTSLKHCAGWSARWCPQACSPCIMSFGIWLAFIQCTWHSLITLTEEKIHALAYW